MVTPIPTITTILMSAPVPLRLTTISHHCHRRQPFRLRRTPRTLTAAPASLPTHFSAAVLHPTTPLLASISPAPPVSISPATVIIVAVKLLTSSLRQPPAPLIAVVTSLDTRINAFGVLPDHSGLNEDEILRVGLRFDSLQPTKEFYATYAKKVSFVSCESTNMEKHDWRHQMQSKDRSWIGRNKIGHGLPFVSFLGVNHHGKFILHGCALLGNEEVLSFEWVFTQWFIYEYDNVLGNKEQKDLEDDAGDSREIISCTSSSVIEKQFQKEYTGILCCHYLAVFSSYKVSRVFAYYVLPYWNKNIKRKHTYIKSSHDVSRSDESHYLFKGICAYFFNVAQEFVNYDEKIAMLHATLDDERTKLVDYHAKVRSKSAADTYASMAI
ncbi:hypothetical protein AHAS_Ahas09G0187800 [Arachis hypogaea]